MAGLNKTIEYKFKLTNADELSGLLDNISELITKTKEIVSKLNIKAEKVNQNTDD